MTWIQILTRGPALAAVLSSLVAGHRSTKMRETRASHPTLRVGRWVRNMDRSNPLPMFLYRK
jgi:hypothetical protein